MNKQHGPRWAGSVFLAPLLFIAVLLAAQTLPATVLSWGDTTYGQATAHGGVWLPTSGTRTVTAGYWHNLVIQPGGNVMAWGLNTYGQTTVPTFLASLNGPAIAVAAGHDHSLALYSTDRLVFGWGDNTYGQTTIPPGLSSVLTIAAGAYHNAALLPNGTVVCWGYNAYGQATAPPTLTNAIAIACGNAFTLALKSDGNVVGWGDNFYHQTDVPADLTNVVAIAAGFAHCLAVRQDGTVVSWGDTSLGQGAPPVDLTNATAVAAGFAHSLALRRDGTVVIWGDNSSGQTNLPFRNTRVRAVFAGYGHSVVLKEDRPEIRSQPQSTITNAGAAVTFRVSASGNNPLSYYWKFNGANVGGNTQSLVLPYVTTNHAGGYWVVVTNVYGSDTSAVASLTVVGAGGDTGPLINTHPQSQTINKGNTAMFGVGATGPEPLCYQWRFFASNSVITNLAAIDLPAATNSALAVSNAQPADGGGYFVVVTNAGGAVTSQVATLVLRSPPTITNEPVDITTNLHATVVFSVGATGTMPLSYRWWFDGVNMGITSGAMTLSGVTTNNAGGYRVVVTNAAGSVTSRVATLTILEEVVSYPVILTNPANQTVDSGSNATFSVVASGAEPLYYQWRFHATNGVVTNFLAAVDLPAATNSSHTVNSAQPVDASGYSVVVFNANGAVTSRVATLIVRAPPTITAEPADTATLVGATAMFQVQVAGAAPLSYQWWFNNGTNITLAASSNVTQTGTSKSVLTLNNVTMNNSGSYFVVVTNALGSATSRLATLSVNYAASLTPAKLFALTHPGGNAFYLTVAFEAGKNYRIQGSTNLRDWVDLTNLLSTSASMDFLDVAATNASQMFYRVVSP